MGLGFAVELSELVICPGHSDSSSNLAWDDDASFRVYIDTTSANSTSRIRKLVLVLL